MNANFHFSHYKSMETLHCHSNQSAWATAIKNNIFVEANVTNMYSKFQLHPPYDFWGDLVGWLCWGLTSQSTIFQSCRDGAIASWVINQYFRGVKCLAQGHNTAAVGLEPRTSRSGVSEEKNFWIFFRKFTLYVAMETIKFSDLDKIHMNHRGLFKKHFCKKNLNIFSETAKIADFHFSHCKSMESCHSNQSSYPIGTKNNIIRSPYL